MTIKPRTDKTAVGFFTSNQVWPWRVCLVGCKQFQNRLPVGAAVTGGAAIKEDGFSICAVGRKPSTAFIFSLTSPAVGAILRAVQGIGESFGAEANAALKFAVFIPKILDGIFFEVNFTGKQSLATGMENNGF